VGSISGGIDFRWDRFPVGSISGGIDFRWDRFPVGRLRGKSDQLIIVTKFKHEIR
jgi:hypothetical protein